MVILWAAAIEAIPGGRAHAWQDSYLVIGRGWLGVLTNLQPVPLNWSPRPVIAAASDPRTTYGALPSNQLFKAHGMLWMMLFSDPGEVIARECWERCIQQGSSCGKNCEGLDHKVAADGLAFNAISSMGDWLWQGGPTMVPWMVHPDQLKCHTWSGGPLMVAITGLGDQS